MDKQKRFVAYLKAMWLKNFSEFIYLLTPQQKIEVRKDFEREEQQRQAFKNEKERMLNEIVESIDLSH